MRIAEFIKHLYSLTGLKSGEKVVGYTPTSTGEVDYIALARKLRVPFVFKNQLADSIGAANTSQQQLAFVKFPAGTLKVGDVIRLSLGVIKSGTSDTSSGFVRVGGTNSMADPSFLSGPSLVGTSTSLGSKLEIEILSSTSVRGVGAVASLAPTASASTGVTWPPIAVPDINVSDLYISFYWAMTSGTEYATVRSFIVEIVPGEQS